jgi:hypothetical protein
VEIYIKFYIPLTKDSIPLSDIFILLLKNLIFKIKLKIFFFFLSFNFNKYYKNKYREFKFFNSLIPFPSEIMTYSGI